MSSNGDEDLDHNGNPRLSPSAYLDAPSSQPIEVDAKSDPSYPAKAKGLQKSLVDQNQELDSDEDRENRFAGPASTWRDYTADERALAASLDQQRADDLSTHLYNAHALKRRLYHPYRATESKPWQSKQHWMRRDEGGEIPWRPDQIWTAWPLAATEVPRGEHFRRECSDDEIEAQTIRKAVPWTPSGDLEDEVQALMLRRAKEKYRRRTWLSMSDAAPPKRPAARSKSNVEQEVSDESCRASNASLESVAVVEPENQPSAPQGERDDYAPEFLTDQDQIDRLLGQSTHHVLSQFNILLAGLHKSRQGHAGQRPDYGQSKRTLRRKRSAAASKLAQNGEDHKIAGATDSGATQAESTHEEPSRPKSSSGAHAPALRDWSEVIGVAALTGWNPAVLDRAAKRCAALFGESMTMKTMPETSASAGRDQIVEYTPDLVAEIEMEDEEDDDDDEGEDWKCPFEDCPRSRQPYEARWLLRQHLVRKHEYRLEDLDGPDEVIADGEAESAKEVQAPNGDEGEGRPPELEPEARNGSILSDMTGGVHTDGFLQTLDVKVRKRPPRTKRPAEVLDDDLAEPDRKRQKSEVHQVGK